MSTEQYHAAMQRLRGERESLTEQAPSRSS